MRHNYYGELLVESHGGSVFVSVGEGEVELESVGELDVDDGADALDDLALGAGLNGGLGVGHVISLKRQTAAAPATISESSLVIAACRVLF